MAGRSPPSCQIQGPWCILCVETFEAVQVSQSIRGGPRDQQQPRRDILHRTSSVASSTGPKRIGHTSPRYEGLVPPSPKGGAGGCSSHPRVIRATGVFGSRRAVPASSTRLAPEGVEAAISTGVDSPVPPGTTERKREEYLRRANPPTSRGACARRSFVMRALATSLRWEVCDPSDRTGRKLRQGFRAHASPGVLSRRVAWFRPIYGHAPTEQTLYSCVIG